jgi:hypothetical protein
LLYEPVKHQKDPVMSTKLLVLVVFGAATVAAAAAGGYAALRRNGSDRPAVVYQSEAPADVAGTTVRLAEPPAPEPVARPTATRAPRTASPAVSPVVTQAPPPAERVPAAEPVDEPTAAPLPAPDAELELPAASGDVRFEPAVVTVPEPPAPQPDELTVAADSVLGIRLESNVSSETARVEDRVSARVSRDVTVDGHTAISSGTRLEGVISSVERGGRFKERARIGVRFHSLVMADGTRLRIETETIFRESESPVAPAATKVGTGAAIGGILGAVIGGKKGAAIGSTVGAAGGTAVVMTGDSAEVLLPSGTPLTVRLTAPLTVEILRQD